MSLKDISEVQLDHTTRCNLACSQCARTQNPFFKDSFSGHSDLQIEDYQVILEPFAPNSFRVTHCGNYGDALASPTFDETFDYTLSKQPSTISVFTNGSLRSASWWSEFAARGGHRLRVVFAIDGLQDTNGIYRENANWSRIEENVRSFTKAGGKARWDFIEFAHNYHQIEEAEKLAKEMGVEQFNVKYTSRFASTQKTVEARTKGGVVSDTKDNINQQDMLQIKNKYGSFDEYVRNTPITCKAVAEKKIFIDMNMRLWPCCWFGAPLYFHRTCKQKTDFLYLIELYGEDFNNLRKHGWNVLNHDFFLNHLENSWNDSNSKHKRIYTCGRTCGDKFEFSSGYGQNKNIKTISPTHERDVGAL